MKCGCCGHATQRPARGLCPPCYKRHQYDGTLGGFPLAGSRRRDEVLEEWVFLRGCGLTLAEIAGKLGMKPGALQRALLRARAAGDPRA